MIELRELIAADLRVAYGVVYDPRTELIITVGASEAVDAALRAICDPGDEVIYHEPCFVAYAPCITLAGGDPGRGLPRPTRPTSESPPTMIEAAITPRTKAHLPGLSRTTRPARSCDRAELEAIAEVAERARPAGHQRRDLRPAGLRRPRARGLRVAAGDARAHRAHRRLQQELRDDRLADRLRVRPRRS